jgi:hypothetical protein
MVQTKAGAHPPPRTSVAAVILLVAGLAEAQRHYLLRLIEGDQGFSLSETQLSDLAKELNLSRIDASAILRTLDNFYGYLNDTTGPDTPATAAQREQLLDAFSRLDTLVAYVSDIDVVADAVLPFVAHNPKIELARKRERLKEGFIPNAIAFASFVDLRPHFSRSGMQIDGVVEYVRQIQLLVHTDSSNPSQDSIVLQLDEKGLASLKEAVELIEAKIKMLSGSPPPLPIR